MAVTQAPAYYAAQHKGKIHRVPDYGAVPIVIRTLCGISCGRGYEIWPEQPDAASSPDACTRCYRPTPPPTLDDLIKDAVDRATRSYAWHAPGHGEFILTRLALRLQRLELTP